MANYKTNYIVTEENTDNVTIKETYAEAIYFANFIGEFTDNDIEIDSFLVKIG